MKRRYRIHTETERDRLTDADIARHRDTRRLLHAYHRLTEPLYRRPLYRDPKTFITLIIIVLLAILIAEVVEKERPPDPPDQQEQVVP